MSRCANHWEHSQILVREGLQKAPIVLRLCAARRGSMARPNKPHRGNPQGCKSQKSMAKQAEQRTVHSILLSVRRGHGSELERTSRIFLQRGTAGIIGAGNRRGSNSLSTCVPRSWRRDESSAIHLAKSDLGHEN